MRSTVSIIRLLPRLATTTALFTTTTAATPHPPQYLTTTQRYLGSSSSTTSTMASSFTLEQRKISDGSFVILKDLMQNGDAAPGPAARQAATAATDGIRKANGKEPVDDGYLFQFWRDIFTAAEQAPSSDHPVLDRLVLFVRELSLQGDVEIKVWEVCIYPHPLRPCVSDQNDESSN